MWEGEDGEEGSEGRGEGKGKGKGKGKGGFGGMCLVMELETPGSLPGLGGDRAHQSASPRTRSVSPSNR